MEKKSGNKYEMSVLVVDDDETVCRFIEKVLKDKGVRKITAVTSGQEAIEAMGIMSKEKRTNKQAPQYDIAILDIVLPDANGFEICKHIKDNNPDIGVILISGYEIENMDIQLQESRADGFLSKPFEISELMDKIERIFEKER